MPRSPEIAVVARYRSGVLALVLVAVSAGLDNFGAATSIGVSGVDGRLRIRTGVVFGVFEGAMPVLGLLLGRSVVNGLGHHARLVAGAVLGLVGGYTVVSELVGSRRGRTGHGQPDSGRLVVLGAVLSIDNLAIGFALGAHHVTVLTAALVMAVVSVALTLVGLELGGRLGDRLGQRSELVGGLVLVGVGVAVASGLL